MENLIWQPELYGNYDFKIYLNPDFGRRMIKSSVSAANQIRMNELANKDLKKLSINWKNPYLFYEETGFISQFNIGRDGVWLSTNHSSITDLLSDKLIEKPIEYNSHNVDSIKENHTLMHLFDKWIKYADAMISK